MLPDANNNKKTKKPLPFWAKVLINCGLMIVAAIFIFWLSTYFLDFWTHHGDSVQVPDVKGLHYDKACELLESQDFEVVLHDSVYEDGVAPGTVVDQNPMDSTNVKPGRVIYLTVNAFYPRTVMLPVLTDISARQARTTLEGLGIKNIAIREVESEYKDLVFGVYYNGKRVTPGTRVPLTARIVLEVGAGIPDEVIAVDSVPEETVVEDTPSEEPAAAHSSNPEPQPAAGHDEPDMFD